MVILGVLLYLLVGAVALGCVNYLGLLPAYSHNNPARELAITGAVVLWPLVPAYVACVMALNLSEALKDFNKKEK